MKYLKVSTDGDWRGAEGKYDKVKQFTKATNYSPSILVTDPTNLNV